MYPDLRRQLIKLSTSCFIVSILFNSTPHLCISAYFFKGIMLAPRIKLTRKKTLYKDCFHTPPANKNNSSTLGRDPHARKISKKQLYNQARSWRYKKGDGLLCWLVVTVKTYPWLDDCFLYLKYQKKYVLLESTALNTLFQ